MKQTYETRENLVHLCPSFVIGFCQFSPAVFLPCFFSVSLSISLLLLFRTRVSSSSRCPTSKFTSRTLKPESTSLSTRKVKLLFLWSHTFGQRAQPTLITNSTSKTPTAIIGCPTSARKLVWETSSSTAVFGGRMRNPCRLSFSFNSFVLYSTVHSYFLLPKKGKKERGRKLNLHTN